MEPSAGVPGADFRCTRVGEVRVSVIAIAFGCLADAVDGRKKRRVFGELLFPEGGVKSVSESRGPTITNTVGPFLAQLIAEAADLAPSEGRSECVVSRSDDSVQHYPVRTSGARESEEDAE